LLDVEYLFDGFPKVELGDVHSELVVVELSEVQEVVDDKAHDF